MLFYGFSGGIDDLHLDDSRGLAGIPGDVYTQVLSDNPFGWDQPGKIDWKQHLCF